MPIQILTNPTAIVCHPLGTEFLLFFSFQLASLIHPDCCSCAAHSVDIKIAEGIIRPTANAELIICIHHVTAVKRVAGNQGKT